MADCREGVRSSKLGVGEGGCSMGMGKQREVDVVVGDPPT